MSSFSNRKPVWMGLIAALGFTSPAFAGTPTITGLANTSYTGGQSPVPLASSVSITGGGSYVEGNIRFDVTNSANSDQLVLTSSATPNASGAVSLVGSDLYLGDGTTSKRIGSIDQTEDGTGGKALKLLFATPLENSGFEDGETSWTVKGERYGDDADEINFDTFTVDLHDDLHYNPGTAQVTVRNPDTAKGGVIFTGSVAAGTGVNSSAALSLTSDGWIQGTSGATPYGSVHGPYATSSVFTAVDGDSLSLEFKAVGTGDDYEVFGLMRRVDDVNGNFIDNSTPTADTSGNNILLFAQRGNDTGGYITITTPGLTAGSYRFQFVGGTYDYTGGLKVGSNLFVDNIRLVSATAIADATVLTIATQVTFQSGCPLNTATRNLSMSVLTQDGGSASASADVAVNSNPDDVDNDCIADSTEGGLADTDGDGTPDSLDADTDNDGVPDVLEGTGDTDGDGTPDFRDVDSDGDGIYDGVESSATGNDTDGDGIDDAYDADLAAGTDADGDGVVESNLTDTDNDGTPDLHDTDSDGDGLSDTTEGSVDTDGDGSGNYRDMDSDGDGITDVTEGAADTDGDGTPNFRDTDSDGDGATDHDENAAGSNPYNAGSWPDADGDGIPDATEGTGDTDGDGTADRLDTDSDGDGILDSVEGITDTDGDGVPNFRDLDSDDDGIPDSVEGITDTDTDGVPNYRDLDSDNDGLYDLIESGIANTDGLDTDNDGMIDAAVGANGLADAVETAVDSGALNYTVANTDGMGPPDYRDLDSDDDGIPDVTESGDAASDPDHDGVVGSGAPAVDALGVTDTVLAPVDTDGTGEPNFRDLDADGDGVLDLVEAGGSDSDSDGVVDGFNDADGDGFDDATEASPLPLTDADHNGRPDYLDAADADNDGVSDASDLDADNDGISNATEGDGMVDSDGDGVPDTLDLDSDNDGIFDLAESGVARVARLDRDGDGRIDGRYGVGSNGIPDVVETSADSGTVNHDSGLARDTDGDTVADFRDRDSDGDGIPDVIEAGHADADGDGVIGRGVPAVNVDGYAGGTDLGLVDSDGDGVPDLLDLDSDNDGLEDVVENFGSGARDDEGRLADVTDSDGDGFDDDVADEGEGAVDTDQDGIPDYRDLDSDGDQMSDLSETGGSDTNGDGEVDDFTDSDNDGRDDYLAQHPVTPSDRDNDGVPDYQSNANKEDSVKTGVSGVGGCTVAANAGFDPVLLLLILVSLGFVGRRQLRGRAGHKE